MSFIVVVRETAGVVEKYARHKTQAEADAHALEYGGFTVPDPGGVKRYWIADSDTKTLVYDSASRTGATAMRDWTTAIQLTDLKMPRSVEDLYDTGITPSDRTKKLLDDKKALRAEKPA